MSWLFLKRFLQRPKQVAYIVPSSKALISKVLEKIDFSEPRVIVEYGPGEGCHTRAILERMHPDSTVIIFELDPVFVKILEEQFADEPRVHVLATDASHLKDELAKLGHERCDYVTSGIPFSTMEAEKKRELLQATYDCITDKPHGAFVIYQITNELKNHARQFPRSESAYCLQNVPPMVITAYYKDGHKNTPQAVESTSHATTNEQPRDKALA